MKLTGLLALAFLVLAGCSKQDETPQPHVASRPAAPESAAPESASAGATPAVAPRAAQPATAPVAAPVQPKAGLKPLAGTVDPRLTSLLQQFVREKGRMPGSLLEFTSSKMDSIPPAPAGHMYALDPATIEVKIVKQ